MASTGRLRLLTFRFGIFLLASIAFHSELVVTRSVLGKASSPKRETCMTRWVSLVGGNSTTPSSAQSSEEVLSSLLITGRRLTVSQLQPTLVTLALAGNRAAAEQLISCTGGSITDCQFDSPCHNGGECVFNHGAGVFSCRCAEGYSDHFCDTVASRCRPGVCQNGGKCQPVQDGGYTCICPPLHTGRHCDSTWWSPELLNDILATLRRIATSQESLHSHDAELANETAAAVRRFLAVSERRSSAQLNQHFSSLRSAITHLRSQDTELSSAVRGIKDRLDELAHHQHSTPSFTATTTTTTTTTVTTATQPATTTAPANQLPFSEGESLPAGSLFDPNRKSSLLTVSPDSRTVTHSSGAEAVVIGAKGYTGGRYVWRLQISTQRHVPGNFGAIGVTTFPLDNSRYTYSRGTSYNWFQNQGNIGLSSSQTAGPAKLSKWANGDRLTMVLDCDLQELHMYLHRTNETRTINMSMRGRNLYLMVYLAESRSSVTIL